MAISNKYRNTFDNLINTSDMEFLNWPGLNDKGSCNALKFESSSMGLLERDFLDKDVLDRSSQLAPKNVDSQMH